MMNTSNFNKFAGLGPQEQEVLGLANANPAQAENFSEPSSATQGTAVSYDPSLEADLDDALRDNLKVIGGAGAAGAAGGLTYARLARRRNRKAREKAMREATERFRTLNKEYLERLSSRVNQGRPAIGSLSTVHRSPEALMGNALYSKISNLSLKERARLREALGLPVDEDLRRIKGNVSSRPEALMGNALYSKISNLSLKERARLREALGLPVDEDLRRIKGNVSSRPEAVPEPANLSARTQGTGINGLRNIPGSSSAIKEVAAKRGLGGAASKVFKGIGRAASKAKNPYVKAALPWIGGFGLGAAGSQALGAKDSGNFLGATADNLKKFINDNPELAYYAAPALLGSGIGGLAGGWKGALGLGIGGLGLGALAKYLKDNPINFG
jgi:hypothetical protein